MVKTLPANAGDSRDMGSMQETQDMRIPWVRKIPWRRAWQPTPEFLLENPMERGAWQATVHRVAKSWTCQATEHTHKTEESRLMDRTL